jgi:microcystin degradation protein MlrC
MLERLLQAGARDVLVAGIVDPPAVQACAQAPESAELELQIGARLDTQLSTPCGIRCRVKRVSDDKRRVLLETPEAAVVLQSDRRAVREMDEIRTLGIEPDYLKIIVVKLGLLVPELRDYAQEHVIALTPGCTDLRLSELPFERLRRPIYPLDTGVEWSP